MRRSQGAKILVCLGLTLIGTGLTGCSNSGAQSTMSTADEKNFKGGPMPPEARKHIAEMMQQAAAKRAAAGGSDVPAPGGPPAAGH